ncbi:MAG TPA: CYTH and CHAD domain-containing protein [Rugosimonospora sp.]|nr:CYTH and CHAD domain-containing protein [Rugosimonospora sp.]
MLEEERKYDVDPSFTVPDLTDCLPEGGSVVAREPKYLRATYYDTADLLLARSGASLRFRRGDTLPWTVKLPTEVPGARHEISRAGAPGTVPGELIALVTAYTRGATLKPGAVLRTTRHVYELRGADGEALAELDDDAVTVLEGKSVRLAFREIEVERHAAGRRLLDRVDDRLRSAGATVGAFMPKHVRALSAIRSDPLGPAEPAPPAPSLPRKARAGEVVVQAVRAGVGRIVAHDPLVRLREPLPGGDTAVHQMRVGCRRLRSDLRTFRPLLDPAWVDGLRAELRWLAEALGHARDAEVLRARLHATAGTDPLAPLDGAALGYLDGELVRRHEQALDALDAVLRGDRYRALLDRLVAAAADPPLDSGKAGAPAKEVLSRLVSRPWQHLVSGAHGSPGAGALDPQAPDGDWHAVRIRAKRARYAVEAVAGTLGGTAAELGRAVAAVQDLLGEHQDAAVAAQTWLALAAGKPDDHALAVTAGRLVERERATVREMRSRFPDAWRAATRRRLVEWLP